jgi:transcriptional regulator with XRE-family HTH domain
MEACFPALKSVRMTVTRSALEVGPLLREWRQRQRLTQLELALDTGISARHLSFVETGRSKPGRDMLLRIGERLEIPIRERNRLLLAAGHAPAFPEHPIGAPELASFRKALKHVLASHEPYPAIVFDRSWNLVAGNAAMGSLLEGIDPALLRPPVNVLSVGLGFAPRFINASEVAGYFYDRVERQLSATADDRLAQLLPKLKRLMRRQDERDATNEPESAQNIGLMKVRAPDGAEWSFICMFGAFDMPFEVTISELAIELLFPADRTTADAFQSLARDREERSTRVGRKQAG